jgi:hypothetical protein
VKKLIYPTCVLLSLAVAMAWLRAQTPTTGASEQAAVIAPNATNKDELMRLVLRAAISNAVARLAAPGVTNTSVAMNAPPTVGTNAPVQSSAGPAAPPAEA